jgi:23S rRNA pseudouridine1911/1915/1917 synthase
MGDIPQDAEVPHIVCAKPWRARKALGQLVMWYAWFMAEPMPRGDVSGPATDAEVGRRVDHVIAHRCGIARRGAWRLLEAGGVELNGRRLAGKDKGRRLEPGDELAIADPEAAQRPLVNDTLALPVAVEQANWLAVCKPAGLAVHPLRSDEKNTALNALIGRYPELLDVGEGGLRSGVVHRLDVPTSGALLLARGQTTWQALREAFQNGAVDKKYHALVHGRVTAPAQHTMRLRVARQKPARVVVVDRDEPRAADAWRCTLSYQPMEHPGELTLLEVTLDTGFLHQIRVMLAALGHPVVGDDRYGSDDALDRAAGRLMLHAHRLHWRDIDVTCPWPNDFAQVIEQARDTS